ncbi:MAG: hypothetical protein HKM95_09610 [Inquilinus sp.]|nr:hypothetical protein [Inquilinus sp.]
MSETLAAIPLDLNQVSQAYPVVHALLPTLELAGWRRFASRLIRSRSPAAGVMTAQRAGYIRGLCCHWQQPSLKHGDLLVVENFSVLDMFDPQSAAHVLIEAMERIAETVECQAIHTALPHAVGSPPGAPPPHAPFRARGHEVAGMVLCKTMEPEASAPTCTVTALQR